MAFDLPPLPQAQLFDSRGFPTSVMQVYWQNVTQALVGALDTLATVTGTTLPSYQQAIQTAQQAAATANQAAVQANQAAMQAQQQAAAQKREAAIQASYISPSSVLTATPTTISVAVHTRYYGDGTSAQVNAGTVAATAPGDTDYVFYDDPSRMGGNVTFQVATNNPVQTGDTHVVGAVMIPNTGTQAGGDGPRLPGYVQAKIGGDPAP